MQILLAFVLLLALCSIYALPVPIESLEEAYDRSLREKRQFGFSPFGGMGGYGSPYGGMGGYGSPYGGMGGYGRPYGGMGGFGRPYGGMGGFGRPYGGMGGFGR